MKPIVRREKNAVASSILRGMKQALASADGTGDLRKYRTRIPHEVDVLRIRTKLGMTPTQFAREFHFDLETLRLWEQGRRVPDGPARAYLKVIDHAPKTVAKALKAA
jgi:putative transcriptional regulator